MLDKLCWQNDLETLYQIWQRLVGIFNEFPVFHILH